MTMSKWTWIALAVCVLAPSARAQEAAEPREPRRPIPVTPLKVQVVFTRLQGDKKIASLPYTITCNAGERSPALLRMGVEVPVPVSMGPSKEGASAFQSIQYKSVGTSIDCRAGGVEDGRYRLELNIEQSSIYSALDEKVRPAGPPESDGKSSAAATEAAVGSMPMFRTFKATFAPMLRDGQTVQYTAATDPVSGEVVKIDVTVNVVK
jgi:hypothetical protein